MSKDLKLAYVMSEEQFKELDEIVDLLQMRATADNEALIERLFRLRGQLTTCPELRQYPLLPNIQSPWAAPLTDSEMRQLSRYNDKLTISLPMAIRQEEKAPDWKLAYTLLQYHCPADLPLFRACLRKILMYTDSRPQDMESVMLYVNERSTSDRSSNPKGWLEYGLVFTGKEGRRMVLGCIQRSLEGDPEFHS